MSGNEVRESVVGSTHLGVAILLCAWRAGAGQWGGVLGEGVSDAASSRWVIDDVANSASSQWARLWTADDIGGNVYGGSGLNEGVWRACVQRSGVGGAVTWRATVCSCCPRLRLWATMNKRQR